ncbi:MAG: bifunctional demethylmenaquinone methyltransferase/2-methoxy-6-polyprenyl-1,4-benzoquinol methylase UbiE [Arenicella sp.]
MSTHSSEPSNQSTEHKNSSSEKTTHFGFQDVAVEEKQNLVGEVFRSVAGKYDLMNDAMSMGSHRLWKWFALGQSGVKKGDKVLDLAAGSGDLSIEFVKKVGANGHVTMTDINEAMLEVGRKKLTNKGIVGNIDYAIVNAEELPYANNTFDCISISLGLRNVTDKDKALAEMARCLKPGGRAIILEFSKPTVEWLEKAYDAYSFNVIPKLGKLLVNDSESYQYLVESIRKHPDQETLKQMMLDANFDQVKVHNLMGGIVAVHIGMKY